MRSRANLNADGAQRVGAIVGCICGQLIVINVDDLYRHDAADVSGHPVAGLFEWRPRREHAGYGAVPAWCRTTRVTRVMGRRVRRKGMAALQAQAVVARSYAWASNRSPYAQTCDTQTCQVYGGAGLDGRPIEDARTDAAVASTAGNLLLRSGTPAATEFSSSTGGWSAGGAFPAVVDLGDVVSPYHNWSASVPASAIGQAFGIGTLTAIDVCRATGWAPTAVASSRCK